LGLSNKKSFTPVGRFCDRVVHGSGWSVYHWISESCNKNITGVFKNPVKKAQRKNPVTILSQDLIQNDKKRIQHDSTVD